jgi:hypothetical protein
MKCFRCGEITTRFTLDQRYCADCERDINRPRTYGIVPASLDGYRSTLVVASSTRTLTARTYEV